MADHEVLLQSSEFQNFLSVQLAFRCVATELHEYVDGKLKAIHQDIYTECSNYPPCEHNCSETWKDTDRWCESCRKWKENISKRIRPRGRKIDWDKMRSHEWPLNYRKLGKIFSHQCWEEGKLNDVPTYLGIIESCNDFRLPSSVLDQIKKIKDARNTYIGHNASLELSESDKTRIFYMLKQFVSAEEVKKGINASSLIQNLDNIEKRRPFHRNKEVANRIQNIEEQIQLAKSQEDTKDRLHVIRKDVETLENDIGHGTIISDRNRVVPFRYYRIFRWPSICGFIIFVLLPAFLFRWTGKDTITVCLTEEFSYPLRPDIYLSHYVKDHTKIAGREWLLQNISDTIFDKQFESTGVLLVAEMGFGKSALISHIVCAESKEPGDELRSRLLAYHVCRFDALNTKKAAIFIRRLAGMIANSIPQFGSALAASDASLSHLNLTKCEYDPVGCMVQSIVVTLSNVESSIDTGQTWIIVIDALDECEDSDTNKNEIISVLERTAHRFPKWIKFLCTSRNISTLVRRLGHFRRMEITSNDDRNKGDIHEFVRNYVNDNQSIFQKLSSAFMLDQKSDIVDRLCEMSSGNFLYIRHALEYLKSTNVLSVENIPNTLENIYQLNFERIYGRTEERFHWARKVLEILCASIEPFKKETIFDMLRFESTNMSKYTFSKEMHTLMHFVRSDERLSFTHISMYHWLTDVTREGTTYFIEKEVGHNLIARYLFHLVKESNNDSDENIINLALHVSESKRQDLISYFKSLPRRFFNRKHESSPLLHKLSKRVNSYLATKLCLYFIKDVDILNADNLTAAFIAAGMGNVETLRALLDAGAKITFRISLPTLFATADDALVIIKTRTFWGYGLLDIAAQHGHADTIRLLLSRNRSMANVFNEMNIKPHHLACEFGHAKVLNIFLELSPRFADQRCLYKAASNGHTQIIRRLLTLDVKDVCLQCNGSFYWLKENESRMQSAFFHLDSSLNNEFPRGTMKDMIENKILKRKPFDDFWTISCETALHVSSRLGFIDIVSLLMSQAQNATTCRDRAGRTPFLTAVIHNRTDIAELLYPLVNSSINNCLEWKLTQDEIMHLNNVERNKLSEGKCPNGSSVVHLIARYGLTNLAEHSLFRDMDWEEEDNEGCRPIHHAACHAGLNMLNYLIYVRKVDISSRSNNGSTAFHIAALCRPYNLYVMYILNSNKMLQLYDYLNCSILQYMYMHPLSIDSSHALIRISETMVLMEKLFSEEDINHVDLTGANIMHYVMKNGYFNSISYIYNTSQDMFFKFILQNDSLQNRPLDEAFYKLPFDDHIVRVPNNCSMEKVIYHKCDGVDVNDYVMYMSPIELSIFFFVTAVSGKIDYHHYFKRYVHEAIRRSNVYVTLMFLIYFRAHGVLGKSGLSPLSTFTSTGKNPLMANLFLGDGAEILKCGRTIEKSPLHQISLNMKNSFWFVEPMRIHTMLKDLSIEYIDKCVDNNGFNVLQRAIEGGNYQLAEYYIERGLSFTKNNKSVVQYIMLGAMAKFPLLTFDTQPYELRVFNKTKYLHSELLVPHVRTNYDITTLLVLSHIPKDEIFRSDVICQNSEATLSLVHLAAANGLLRSLEYIAKRWGRKALLCKNADLISPIYLAYAFDQSEVIRYLEEQNITLIFPKLKPELYLSFILLFDMNNLNPRKQHCLRSIIQCVKKFSYSPHNYLTLLRGSICLKRISCSDILPELADQLKITQKITSQLVRILLRILELKDDIKNHDANNNCIMIVSGQCTLEFPKLRALMSSVPITLKNITALVIWMETVNKQPTVYRMQWLFNRWNLIMQSVNMIKDHLKFLETISPIIEPVLDKRVLYLRRLTLIGRYDQLKTISTISQYILNITNVRFSIELPRIMMNVFKSLNDLFSQKKQQNNS